MNIFKVLVVDDEVDWRDTFVENMQTVPLSALAGEPYDGIVLETAANQLDADKAVARRHNDAYDLVLLDLRYPRTPDDALPDEEPPEGFQGMVWLPVLRKLQPRAAIVVLTAFPYGQQLLHAVKAVRDCHASDFIPKTASFDEMVSRICFACMAARRRQQQIALQKEMVSLARTQAVRAYIEDVAAMIHNTKAYVNRLAARLETRDSSVIEDMPELMRVQIRGFVSEFDTLTAKMDDRIGTGGKNKEQCDIADLVRSVLFAYEPWCEEAGVVVKAVIGERTSSCISYVNSIKVALYETINNAIESLEDSPRRPGERELAVTTRGEGHEITVEILDNGCGISDYAMEHLFERGVTTKDSDAHQGMGLYVAKHMMDGIGGSIMVRNRAEGGAAVELTIRDLS